MIKHVLYWVGLLLGSSLSPGFRLMSWALKDYFNLESALKGPAAMAFEFQRFSAVLDASATEILFRVCPLLILILLGSSLFIIAFAHLFRKLVLMSMQRLSAKAAQATS